MEEADDTQQKLWQMQIVQILVHVFEMHLPKLNLCCMV